MRGRTVSPSIALALLLCLQAGAGEDQQAPTPFSVAKPTYKEKAIAAFNLNDKTDPPKREGVVFMGGSLIQNMPSLTKDMAPMPVVNRGVEGTTDKLIELYDLGVGKFKPKVLVCHFGEEDLSAPGADPKKIFSNVKAFVERVKSERPTLKIAFISSKAAPRQEASLDSQRKFDSLLKDLCGVEENLSFLDVSSVILEPGGRVKSELFKKDGVTLNSQGYESLSKALRPQILKIWSEAARR